MRTLPRLVGFRLHTLAVKAGNACKSSPNASRLSGCTWYSRLACFRLGSDRENAPSCDGDMLIGPLRVNAYCRPMPALPCHRLASAFKVLAPKTLNTARICKWSCRFSPTPGRSFTTSTPSDCSRAPGPTPESCKICGDPIAPADRITSALACTVVTSPPRRTTAPETRFRPSGAVANTSRSTFAPVQIVRLRRSRTGRRNALDVFQRQPDFWLTSK